MDNTTFGNDVPTLPHWTGPSRAIVQVQAILFASLVASLLSAFLAVLGKQWLNSYDSVDVRGSAIHRGRNRQKKLDNIIAWRFHYVLEALPLMLQAALLLLGCALVRYLWEINIAVASVILGITSLGFIFYLSIVVAGTVSESCPYKTHGARILRFILRIPSKTRITGQQAIELDLRCITWILHTSLDKDVHWLTSNYLATVPEFPYREPTQILDCFRILASCINVRACAADVAEELGQLVAAASRGFFSNFRHLSLIDHSPHRIEDLRQLYHMNFDSHPDMDSPDLPFRYTTITLHTLFNQDLGLRTVQWNYGTPSALEHVLLARRIAKAAQDGYKQSRKLRRWTLRFAFYSLSLDPQPPAFVIANSLNIIMCDLGFDLWAATSVYDQYVHSDPNVTTSIILTRNQPNNR